MSTRSIVSKANARTSRGRLRWLWLSFALLILDQATKYVASTHLNYGDRVYVTGFFNWTHLHNTGAAFSFLADAGGWQQPFLITLALVVSVALVYWLWRTPQGLACRLGLSTLLGGALGNLVDRVLRGHVVDYLDFHYAHWHWPAFNLADVWITTGAALLIWADMKRRH